eukprot:Nk52_evm14s16 gene=Nk52_evmTU14s16
MVFRIVANNSISTRTLLSASVARVIRAGAGAGSVRVQSQRCFLWTSKRAMKEVGPGGDQQQCKVKEETVQNRLRGSDIVFSGMQPSGVPHIGNYCGALKNWVHLQHSCDKAFYAVVDLHRITVPYNVDEFKKSIVDGVITFLACGIQAGNNNPKVHILQQSLIPELSQLAWVLGCVTTEGYLKRMTQYKSKSAKQKGNASLGLYSYPVLMAADILLYRATRVPVGDDQVQHLELTNQIVSSFNSTFDTTYFEAVEAIIPENAARIMNLKKPTAKMSKSEPSEVTRIMVDDDPDDISKKIQGAATDALAGIAFDREGRPGVSNLIEILAAFSDQSIDDIERKHGQLSKAEFKKVVTDACVTSLAPIRENIIRLRKDMGFVQDVIREGEVAAKEIAVETLEDVRNITGLNPGRLV